MAKKVKIYAKKTGVKYTAESPDELNTLSIINFVFVNKSTQGFTLEKMKKSLEIIDIVEEEQKKIDQAKKEFKKKGKEGEYDEEKHFVEFTARQHEMIKEEVNSAQFPFMQKKFLEVVEREILQNEEE